MTGAEFFSAAVGFATLAVVVAVALLGLTWGLCTGALRLVWRWLAGS